MIAYTAWDSLRAIARGYDAALTLIPGERLALATYREGPFVPLAMRRLAGRLRARLR